MVVICHRRQYNANMKIRQAFKFKLEPNGAQVNQLLRYAGACRYVYNKALALQKANFSEGNKYIPNAIESTGKKS